VRGGLLEPEETSWITCSSTSPSEQQAIDLLEDLPWGDVEQEIYGLEVALSLALEATGAAIQLWEEEGEQRFGDEFALSADEVASLDEDWRLAYIARLLYTAANAYRVSPDALPGRSSEALATSPLAWSEAGSIARLLRGLNDILHGLPPDDVAPRI
jgi:hypothetical protein